MGKEKLEVIKEADLTNNCPKCFNPGLKLTFFQKHTYGKLFHRTTSDVSNEIKCNKCTSSIYPVNWTEDIERVFEYYQKTAIPKPTSLKFTSLFYILMLLFIVAIGAAVYLYLEGIIQF